MNAAERRQKVIDLYQQGLLTGQIATAMGIRSSVVSLDIHKARAKGILPPPRSGLPSSAARHLMKKMGRNHKSLGRMLDVFDALTREEALWLMGTLPKDLTMAEYLASMVCDVYAEEHSL